MNLDRVQGRLRRWVGVFEQGWGRLIGDETLRMRGERDSWMGRMQQDYGEPRDLRARPMPHNRR
ncbi:MAG: CsbD family protein [Betaproteobacteria bacterium]|nr:MAG: CsbD family protein [Betaproteobacteria bacterium]